MTAILLAVIFFTDRDIFNKEDIVINSIKYDIIFTLK